MKLHHTAAFALMGWLLIMPPCANCPGRGCDCRLNSSAPLSEWRHCEKYPSRDACEGQLGIPPNDVVRFADVAGPCFDNEGTQAAECVPENDPRLRE